MKKQSLLLGAVFLVLLPASALRAQEIPTYPTLPCQGDCPVYIPAKATDKPFPKFPPSQFRQFEEAIVDVNFTVGIDGHVRNPIVEQITGSTEFTHSVFEALSLYKYEPATEGGKHVEENVRLRFIFRFNRGDSGARSSVVGLYQDAISKTDAASEITALRAITSEKRLDLYEATMVAAALAHIEAKTGAYDDALKDIRIATATNGNFLDDREKEHALRLHVVLAAQAGQYAEAFENFDDLKKAMSGSPDPDTAQLIAKLHAEIDSTKPLWAAGKIPADGSTGVWNHTMLRRSFGFADIKGSLTKFHLRCETHGIESPVTDAATWTIPPTWTKCNILVEGAPATAFRFGEAQPDTASAAAKPN